MSSVLEANKWNSLVQFVIAPAAAKSPRPSSVTLSERTDYSKRHTPWLAYFRAPLYFTLDSHGNYVAIYRGNVAFTKYSFSTFIQYNLVDKPKVLMLSPKFLIGLKFFLLCSYVHNTLKNIHLDQRNPDEYIACPVYILPRKTVSHTHSATLSSERLNPFSWFLFEFCHIQKEMQF